jgi:hypothetical protein
MEELRQRINPDSHYGSGDFAFKVISFSMEREPDFLETDGKIRP